MDMIQPIRTTYGRSEERGERKEECSDPHPQRKGHVALILLIFSAGFKFLSDIIMCHAVYAVLCVIQSKVTRYRDGVIIKSAKSPMPKSKRVKIGALCSPPYPSS
eukprot:1319458-Amorphochlora_amoeboformis.AAC.1